jgi:hypothetical protein
MSRAGKPPYVWRIFVGNFTAAEVPVLRVADGDGHVTQHRIRQRRIHSLDQVRSVNRRRRPEAAGHGEGDRASLHRAPAGQRGLDDAVRGRPELELPIGERDRRRHRRVGHDVPGVVAAEHEDLALLAPDVGASTARRLERSDADRLLAKGGGVVVHEPREALRVELRPRRARRLALPDLEGHAAALDLDRLEVGRAQGRRDVLERLGLPGYR